MISSEEKAKIKEEAQKEAEEEAASIVQNSVMNAEKQAKEEADKISKEIIEAARIDGAGGISTYLGFHEIFSSTISVFGKFSSIRERPVIPDAVTVACRPLSRNFFIFFTKLS